MEKKFCKDCKFYKQVNPSYLVPGNTDLCTKFTFYPDLVRGEPRFATAYRQRNPYPIQFCEDLSCGIEAKFFEPKEEMQVTPPPTSETVRIKDGIKRSWFYFLKNRKYDEN